jgi:hypothetical protein
VVLWGVLAALFAGVVPFGVVWVLMRRGRVTDIHVAQKERRWLPLGAAFLSGGVALAAFRVLGAPRELHALGLVYLANAAAFAMVSHFWKISVHAGVYSGAFAACALAVNAWWALALVAVPLVVWARSRRGRHTVTQGIAGAVMAATLTAATYLAATGL